MTIKRLGWRKKDVTTLVYSLRAVDMLKARGWLFVRWCPDGRALLTKEVTVPCVEEVAVNGN